MASNSDAILIYLFRVKLILPFSFWLHLINMCMYSFWGWFPSIRWANLHPSWFGFLPLDEQTFIHPDYGICHELLHAIVFNVNTWSSLVSWLGRALILSLIMLLHIWSSLATHVIFKWQLLIVLIILNLMVRALDCLLFLLISNSRNTLS